MSPVLSDISIEWLFPETKEVLLSPVGNTFLFPGDSLIGYSVVCDTTRYHANPKSVRHLLKSNGMRIVCVVNLLEKDSNSSVCFFKISVISVLESLPCYL